jgi:hypothetical protein
LAGAKTIRRTHLARAVAAQGTGDSHGAILQFAIDSLETADVIEAVRREPEASQHDQEHERMPDLQPEPERFEDHSMQ